MCGAREDFVALVDIGERYGMGKGQMWLDGSRGERLVMGKEVVLGAYFVENMAFAPKSSISKSLKRAPLPQF